MFGLFAVCLLISHSSCSCFPNHIAFSSSGFSLGFTKNQTLSLLTKAHSCLPHLLSLELDRLQDIFLLLLCLQHHYSSVSESAEDKKSHSATLSLRPPETRFQPENTKFRQLRTGRNDLLDRKDYIHIAEFAICEILENMSCFFWQITDAVTSNIYWSSDEDEDFDFYETFQIVKTALKQFLVCETFLQKQWNGPFVFYQTGN